MPGIARSTVAVVGLALVALATLEAPSVAAQSAVWSVATVTAPGAGPAVRLLERAVHSGTTQSYRGTQYVASWTPGGASTTVLQVTHRPGTGSMVKVVPSVASRGGSLVDQDLLVPPSSATGFDATALSLLQSHYGLAVADHVTCVGRSATVIEARRPAAASAPATVAGRFWLDDDSGLVLRREVYDESGRLLRASSFVTLDMTSPPTAPQSPPQALASTGPVTEKLDAPARRELVRHGFTVPATLPPGLDLYDARLRAGDAADGAAGHVPADDDAHAEGRVVHLAYSDGLSTLSLFEQAGRLDADQLTGWHTDTIAGHPVHVQEAPTRRVSWESDGMVFTLLADASPTTIAAVVAALPHAAPRDDGGFWHRLERGLARAGSWLNPFD